MGRAGVSEGKEVSWAAGWFVELGWADLGSLGWVWVSIFWFSSLLLLLFLFLFKLTQPNLFEFKIEFEFNSNTQTNKSMLQHGCNNKN